MSKRKLVCPYKSTNRNKCTHKDGGDNFVFHNPLNCPIFQKWLDKVNTELKKDFVALKSHEDGY